MKHLSRRIFLQNLAIGAGATAAVVALPGLVSIPKKSLTNYEGKKLNIALCGLGVYANILAQGLQDAQYCRIAGIVTGTPGKAAEWQKRYMIPQKNIYNYQNFDDIKNNKDIEINK